MKVGLPVPEKATRGALMRNIRDYHATPGNTLMTIGKHKGNTYEQVPRSYGLWADAEEKANGANMHPDLRRYVMWFRRQANPDLPEQVTTLDKMNNPEKYAVVSFPEGSMKSDTDLSWDEVRSMPTGNKKGYGQEQLPLRPQPSSSSSSSRPTKRPVAKDKGTARMGIEPDPKVLDEIRALETRLATLKQQMGPEEDAPEAGTPKNQDAIENPLGDFPLYHNQATEEDAVEAVHPKNQDAIQNPPGDFSLYHNQATEENAAEAVRPKNQDAIQNSLGDFLLYHNQATEEDATIAGHPEDQEPTGDVIDELESDDEYMVLLTDHVEGIIKDRLLAKDFSVEALTTILENVFGESGEYLPKRGAMPRRTTFGEEDKGARRISLGYY
ncbi:GIP, partial [Symbiodinium microadriaticum]